MSWMVRMFAVATLLGCASCSCETDLGQLQFACATTDDCAAGYFCVEGVCSSTLPGVEPLAGDDAGADAGELDSGVPDAGRIKGCGRGATEICDDGSDNDCDELIDCLDPLCDAQSCAPNGRTCVLSACSCGGDAGSSVGREASCSDFADNDCDGTIDCADSDCEGESCGANGRSCAELVCSCSGNGGPAQTAEAQCADGVDNDCDGVADCADSSCGGRDCGSNGRQCSGTRCVCGGNGGTAQAAETLCTDGSDNDCDGAADCADPGCSGVTCSINGHACSAGACACSGNGGTAQTSESACADGFDNDCDGDTDCADATCAGLVCGAGCRCIGGAKAEDVCSNGVDDDGDFSIDCADSNCAGRACGSGCICSGLRAIETSCADGQDNDGDMLADCNDTDCCAGCPANCEAACADGLDNDADMLIDCVDPHCDGKACGMNGGVCGNAMCRCSGNGGIAETAESACSDGFDNDCDGLVDCADPNCIARPCTCEVNCGDGVDNDCDGMADCADAKCLRKACSASQPAAICCGTGANAQVCKNLATDESNCGGCGVSCANGRVCVAANNGSVSSGRCGCTKNDNCSLGQTCDLGALYCVCAAATECPSPGVCSATAGGFCHY